MSYISTGDSNDGSFLDSIKNFFSQHSGPSLGGVRKAPVPLSQIQTLDQVADYAYKGMLVCADKKSEYWKNLPVFALWNDAYNAYKEVFDSATSELSRISVSAGKTHLHEADLLAAKAYGNEKASKGEPPPVIATSPDAVPVPEQLKTAGFPIWVVPIGIGLYFLHKKGKKGKKGKKRGRR